jgi:DNA-binding transcriptional regulator YdaS (Cro superfamily)
MSVMEALRVYLKTLPVDQQVAFAKRCDTSLNYLRKAMSAGQKLSEGLAIQIERESAGQVRCEEIRPDVDWAYIRGTRKLRASH